MASEGNSHQKLEKALEITKGMYKTLVLTSPEAISATDLDGNFTFVSPQTIELHGFDNEEELLGTSFFNLIDKEHHDEIIAGLEANKGNGTLKGIEYNLVKKDGTTFPAELNVSTFISPAKEPLGYIATVRDITDRKKLEEQLRQAYKMEAVGLLAGRFAHDFNNFLQIIRGYTELIMATEDPPASVIENLTEIRNAESKAEFLVEQLLAFGRKQILKLSNIDTNALINDMSKMMKSTVGEDINLKLDLQEGIDTIRIDPVQLSQVIINIIFNARDAISDVGAIEVKTRNVFFNKEHVNFYAMNYNEGDCVEISIRDTGTGIPDSIKDKIFQPFFTTKEMNKGTGLGLASVYGIVKQSGGYIFFDSKEGDGTTFRIYFPKIDAAPDAASLIEDSTHIGLKGDEKILLVEDDDLVRSFIETMMRSYGYKIRSAKDGDEALSRLNGTAKVDLLITDVVLTKLNGRQVANKVKEKMPDCKVLYISSYNDNVITHHGILEDDINFLRKPFSTGEFLEKVRSILD